MALSIEEKERRKEERRIKKLNETHKIIDGIDHKLCSICQEWKPSADKYFYKNKSNSIDGFHPYCKKCASKKSRQWEIDNPEKYKENNDRKNKNLSAKTIQYMKEKNKRQRESGYYLNWQRNNKDKVQRYRDYREQHKKHEISYVEWMSCKEYFNNECAYCGLHISEHFNKYAGELKWTDFHREHVDDEGSNKLDNCIPSCKSCNSSKHTSTFEEWYCDNNQNYTEERLNKIYKWLGEDHKNYIESL